MEEFFAKHYLGGADSRRLYVGIGTQLLGACWELPAVAAMPPALSLRLSSALMQMVRTGPPRILRPFQQGSMAVFTGRTFSWLVH